MATHIGAIQRRLPPAQRLIVRSIPRPLAHHLSTAPQHDEAPPSSPPSTDPKLLSRIYNANRALYRKSVSQLRKTYAAEIAAQRSRDAAIAAAAESKRKRQVLERRRLKAIRSAENAMAQLQRAERRRIEWEKELEVTQQLRDKKKELFQKARQRVVDQLEAEAHLWLTNEQEVERALGNPRASQILWARRGGIIGAPGGVVSLSLMYCWCLVFIFAF
jgi:hypothetical protein